jgi:4a-hydroxytetrahydrobiopterin dehydratase
VQVKGYAKAVYLANLGAFLADQAGHHPDVSFGWGYCKVRFTTHAAGGLTEGDVICAAKFDAAVG